MSVRTISEEVFEKFCKKKRVTCTRIPESTEKSSDYELILDSTKIITEVKQIEKNNSDSEKESFMADGGVALGSAPSTRVRQHIVKAYSQIKNSCKNKYPGMVVLFNNAGLLNRIDCFTVSTAMFGDFAVSIYLNNENNIVAGAQKFQGKRKVTKSSLRSLSAVAILTNGFSSDPEFVVYHNPYADIPIDPILFSQITDKQYKHKGPHEMESGSWEQNIIKLKL